MDNRQDFKTEIKNSVGYAIDSFVDDIEEEVSNILANCEIAHDLLLYLDIDDDKIKDISAELSEAISSLKELSVSLY